MLRNQTTPQNEMGEVLLGGILVEDEEKTELEPPETLARAEAFAVAVAARLSGNDPAVARKTEEFLDEQTQFLKVQKEHLRQEYPVRLATLKGQKREGDHPRDSIRRLNFRTSASLR